MRIFKIIGYGFFLFLVIMLLLFAMSVVTQSEQTIDYPWAVAIVAVLLAAFSHWFSRGMKAASVGQALTLGLIWALMLVGILLFITIPNQTTELLFGRWSTYLMFLGVAAGPLLRRFEMKEN